MEARKYDFVVFGATGHTGKDLIMEIARFLSSVPREKHFTWAVAGRSISKLNEALTELSEMLKRPTLRNVDKIVADISNPESLREMARQSCVVLNCVGPYLLYGEEVVRACVQGGTHHLDLAAEDQFLEYIQLKYHKPARDSGALVIGATGFGSIPSDYGATYLEENFCGELNSVQSYINIFDGLKPPDFYNGTWNSVLLMLSRLPELKSTWDQLYPHPYFDFEHKLLRRSVEYNEDLKCWCISVPLPDARTMKRSQRYRFFEQKRRPFQTQVWLQTPNILYALFMAIAICVLFAFARFKFTRSLLQKYPKLFSFGMASSGKTATKRSDLPFTFTLIGQGWDRMSIPKSGSPNKKLILKIKGINAADDATVKLMLQAGISVIKERELMPSRPSAGITLVD